MFLHSCSISCLLWNISGSPTACGAVVRAGGTQQSQLFLLAMAMGLSSGILN